MKLLGSSQAMGNIILEKMANLGLGSVVTSSYYTIIIVYYDLYAGHLRKTKQCKLHRRCLDDIKTPQTFIGLSGSGWG